MNSLQFQELLDFVSETGDSAFFPYRNASFVLVPAATYLSRIGTGKASAQSLTDAELVEKINREIDGIGHDNSPQMLAIDTNSVHDTLEDTHVQDGI
ncbi:hypothetical protein HY627_00910 [Candidatus Uhrbacteria bacterium]|nr:hypothetical protein [Candidatus Uhrbacteria bacterium]